MHVRLTDASSFHLGESEDAHNQVYNNDGQPDNESSFGHELLAGGASFAAFRAFENHQRAEGMSLHSYSHYPFLQSLTYICTGKPVDHALAKEILAGFAGAEVDKLAETKGMDEVDKIRAKHQAKENVSNMYDEHYINNKGADRYDPNQYDPPSQLGYGEDNY